MNKRHTLALSEVIQRSLAYDPNDVLPLLKYLDLSKESLSLRKDTTKSDADVIASYLCKMGSNDIATLFRGGDGVHYNEVVYDVGRKLKVPGIDKEKPAYKNEEKIIEKLFADALDKMTEDEKRQLFGSIGISSKAIPVSASGALITQLLLKEFGGFAVYKGALVVSNLVSRAILGSGLSFATNTAITRTIGAALGPIGWIASGAWLAVEIAGPAFRKTVPAVIHIAMLRQMVTKRVVVGVVGEGSVGKDSLFKTVFEIDTRNIKAVAGATVTTEVYNWSLNHSNSSNDIAQVVNFPGFNDIDEQVNNLSNDHLNHADLFIMVVDVNRGISDVEVSRLEGLKRRRRPILVCLNKMDLPKPADEAALVEAAEKRLTGVDIIKTAFDPDPRLHLGEPIGVSEVKDWVLRELRRAGKEV